MSIRFGTDLVVRPVVDEPGLAAALAVRERVFVGEQGVARDIEHDEDDAVAFHVVAVVGTTTVATGRLVVDATHTTARIGRIAVLPEWRRQGVAGRIIDALEQEAARHGVQEVSLHAQTYVRALYERHGYEVSGPESMEAGIAHVPMAKRIGPVGVRDGDG